MLGKAPTNRPAEPHLAGFGARFRHRPSWRQDSPLRLGQKERGSKALTHSKAHWRIVGDDLDRGTKLPESRWCPAKS